MDTIHIADGFRGQIMHVIPKPLLKEASKHMLVAELYPTDMGWFPSARHHLFVRLNGATEHILIYCVKGKGWVEVDGKRLSISHGHALLIPKGRPHSYGADEDNPWSIHWVHFSGEDAVCYTSLLPPGEHVLPVAPAIAARLEQLFRECYNVFANGYTPSRILFTAQVLRHLLALLFHSNPAFLIGIATASRRSFDHSLEYMRQHLDGSLSLSAIASEANFSIARFSTLFKAITGFSPVEYYISPDLSGLVLHETGFLPCNDWWNFPNVLSPFWRLLYPPASGQCNTGRWLAGKSFPRVKTGVL